MNTILMGNSFLNWSISTVILAGLCFLLLMVRKILAKRLGDWSSKTQNYIDDLVYEVIRRTHFVFLLSISIYAAIQFLILPGRARTIVDTIVILILIWQGAIWATAASSLFLKHYREKKLAADPSVATSLGALEFVLKLVLWTLALLLALDNLGIDVTALVASLGIGGIAVALAVQNILGDLFASLSIVLDKPFVLGDFIIVGDLMGTVEHIGLKTTRIRSLSGEQLVFSNSDLLNSRIRNFKRMFERRVVFGFGVIYQTPLAKLKTIPATVKSIITSIEHTRFDRAHFARYGDSSLDFEVVYYVLVPDYNTYMDIQQEINLRLFEHFEREGIEFAYPTRTIFIQKEETENPSP